MVQPVRYTFVCQDLPEETFAVNRLQGQESLSQLYRFDIELRSQRSDIALKTLLSQSCRLGLRVNGEERLVHGILSDCQILRQMGDQVVYRAVLVPRLWQLSLYQANEVYLRQSVPDTLRQILQEAGFTGLDYELALSRNYRTWPYRCQYGETHLNFLQRLMEREGMYYFFEQGEAAEKLIITDHLQFHVNMPRPSVVYDPVSGLEGQRFGSSVQALVCHQKRVARQVVLRDYNDNTPSVDIKGQATVDADGIGEVNVFGLNIVSADEGRELATIRAQQLRAGAEVFFGESTVERLAAGYTFSLERHFREGFNRSYLVTSVSHAGVDPSLSGGGNGSTVQEAYRNSFTAIPADVQFRPEPCAEKPQILGTLDAVIDAEGNGLYAEIDAEGRYKVVLPFDRQQREEGKASHWIRMSQTFAGEQEGMHFPLRKGTHVLLSFIGGDPDRPVITGAMPNAAHPSVITADNQTKSKIQTRAGNFIEMEDREESKRIKLYSPHANTYMHLGAHNAPGDGIVMVSEGLNRQEIGGGTKATLVSKATLDRWTRENSPILATDADDELFNETAMFQFKKLQADGTSQGLMTADDENAGDYHISRRVGDYYGWKQGNDYAYLNGKGFQFGPTYEEIHLRTNGIEQNEKFNIPTSLKGAINFNPSQSHISKKWGDAIGYQNGSAYNWRDGADYNIGGGYAETHIAGATSTLNKSDWENDLCPPPPFPADGHMITGENMTLNSGAAAIDKMIGDQYSYVKGNALKIVVGNIETQHYGNLYESRYDGRQEDVTYITYHDKEVAITRTISDEDREMTWNYHPENGALSSFSASSQCGHVNFETKLMPTFDTSIDISTLSFGLEIGINSFGINLTGCEFSVGFQPFKCEISPGEYEIELPGFKHSTSAIELETKLTALETAMTEIGNTLVKADASQVEISTGFVNLRTAMLKMFA